LTQVGTVSHYYDKIGVAIVKLEKPVKVGDMLNFGGEEDGFKQELSSMQMDHEAVTTAKKGDEVGIKVDQKAKEGTPVHLA
jgi:translation elongation factor EF-1alpha